MLIDNCICCGEKMGYQEAYSTSCEDDDHQFLIDYRKNYEVYSIYFKKDNIAYTITDKKFENAISFSKDFQDAMVYDSFKISRKYKFDFTKVTANNIDSIFNRYYKIRIFS